MLSHFSHAWLFVNLWTVAYLASLSMRFSRQEYWSGLSCPSPGDCPDPGIKPASFMSPALVGSLPLTPPGICRDNKQRIYSSVWFSCSVMSDSLRPHGLQPARLPCPSPTPRTCSNSSLSSQWWHPTISSSVIPFSSCLQSFPASRSFPKSRFFASWGQSIVSSASASVLPMNSQDWFPSGLTDLISLQSKGVSRVFSNTTIQKHQFFSAQVSLWSNSHIHTWLLEKP